MNVIIVGHYGVGAPVIRSVGVVGVTPLGLRRPISIVLTRILTVMPVTLTVLAVSLTVLPRVLTILLTLCLGVSLGGRLLAARPIRVGVGGTGVRSRSRACLCASSGPWTYVYTPTISGVVSTAVVDSAVAPSFSNCSAVTRIVSRHLVKAAVHSSSVSASILCGR